MACHRPYLGGNDVSISGRTVGGKTVKIGAGVGGDLRTELSKPLSAFGLLRTVQETPQAELSFIYGLDPQLVEESHTPASTIEMIQEGTAGLPTVQDLALPDGSAFSASGTADYCLLYSAGDATTYYLWFSVGTAADPAVGGATGIQATISAADTPDAVATTVTTAVDALGDFSAVRTNNTVRITNAANGASTSLTDVSMPATDRGTVSTNNSTLSVAAAAGASASVLRSHRSVRYHPGQGVIARFTALFDTPTTTSSQFAGLSNEVSGFQFGYFADTEFAIRRHDKNIPEVRTLTLSSGAGGAETSTVVLDGVTHSVPLTAGTPQHNALEIAQYSFSASSWGAFNVEDTVVFFSREFRYGARSNTYSFTSASAAGTFSQTTPGQDPVDVVIPQNQWNVDKCDGTGPGGMTLDPSKANVFEISYQWLGAGAIIFEIENPLSGKFEVVHRVQYANANTEPSVQVPHMLLDWESQNHGGGISPTIQAFSGCALLEGEDNQLGSLHSASGTHTTSSADEEAVYSIYAPHIFAGIPNRAESHIQSLALVNDAGKSATVLLYLNATPDMPHWEYINGGSTLLEDTSSTAVAGGVLVYSTVVAGGDSKNINLRINGLDLGHDDSLSIVVKRNTSTNVEIAYSLSWVEDR